LAGLAFSDVTTVYVGIGSLRQFGDVHTFT
jgi:hypothetical protein